MQKALPTGELAKRAGVGIQTIRFYERKGLIAVPPRTQSGYRRYPPDAVDRIRFIRRAQKLGFSLKDVAELLELKLDPRGDCGPVREKVARKLGEIDGKLADLGRMRRALASVADDCAGDGPVRDCAILEALEPEPLT